MWGIMGKHNLKGKMLLHGSQWLAGSVGHRFALTGKISNYAEVPGLN